MLVAKIFNSFPNDKFLHWTRLKTFAEDEINVTQKLKYSLGRVEKPAFSPSPIIGFYPINDRKSLFLQ